MAEVCAWHKTTECLEKTGVLVLQQSQSAPAEREEFDAALAVADGVFGNDRKVLFYQELGTFCTTSALLSWLGTETGAMQQTTRTLHGPGPGSRRGKGNETRPTTRRRSERRQR